MVSDLHLDRKVLNADRFPKGDHWGSEKRYHTLFKEEQILSFCASCPLKSIHTFEKPVIGDTKHPVSESSIKPAAVASLKLETASGSRVCHSRICIGLRGLSLFEMLE